MLNCRSSWIAGSSPAMTKPEAPGLRFFLLVTTGHSRSKNGVASLAYAPVVHVELPLIMDCRIKSGNDET
jgi:hypothetical protein